MKEIIVYLDDYLYSGNGYYDLIYLDFRTKEDFDGYRQITNLPEDSKGSYLKIEGYKSPRRLVRGAYYALNIDMLSQVPREPQQNSLVIAHSYNFERFNGGPDNRGGDNPRSVGPVGIDNWAGDYESLLLQPHRPLYPTDFAVSQSNPIDSLCDVPQSGHMKFIVNNVGQANWNEVVKNELVLAVFDIGAPIDAKATTVAKYVNTYASSYAVDKPCLLLSHWDLDHYHCLLQMSDDEINNFSKFICVDGMRSNMSKGLFRRIEGILGSKRVFCIKPSPRIIGTAYPHVHQVYSDNTFGIYVAEESRNINYSGLFFYAQGSKGNVIFSGDGLPVQASDVLQMSSTANSHISRDHYLVVPHHGGDYNGNKAYKTYSVPVGLNPSSAIISVGKNRYGHPKSEMLRWLSSVAPWTIERTDQSGTINKVIV